jgi:O-antigen ligase
LIARVGRAGANIIIWLILLLLVVLTALTGSAGSVFAVLLALLLLPVMFSSAARQRIGAQPAMWMFLLAFVAIMVCYAITAVNPGNLLYGTALLALPLAPLLYGAMPHWRTDRPALVLLGLCLVGTLICALVAANSAFLTQVERATGFLMGPNVLARLALSLGFMALGGMFLTRLRWRYALYLGPIAAGIVLVLTGTRGAVLALPFQVLLLAGFLAADRSERRQLLVLLGLGLVGGVLVLANSARFESLIEVIGEVIAGQTSSDGATSERMTMLVGAWGTFLHSPWVGFGWANLRPAAALAMDMTPYGTDPGGAFQFHNDFANFAVAAGIVGVLALVAMLAAPVVGALAAPRDRFYRARLYCCLQLSVGFLVFGLTDFTMGYDLPTTLYAFLTAMILATFREGATPSAGGPSGRA